MDETIYNYRLEDESRDIKQFLNATENEILKKLQKIQTFIFSQIQTNQKPLSSKDMKEIL